MNNEERLKDVYDLLAKVAAIGATDDEVASLYALAVVRLAEFNTAAAARRLACDWHTVSNRLKSARLYLRAPRPPQVVLPPPMKP